jgi:uncharacterized lipoprotein YajG
MIWSLAVPYACWLSRHLFAALVENFVLRWFLHWAQQQLTCQLTLMQLVAMTQEENLDLLMSSKFHFAFVR